MKRAEPEAKGPRSGARPRFRIPGPQRRPANPARTGATYGDVAAAAGSPRAHRAVGNIMRTCTAPGVPAHRVIAAAGRLGGYGGNLELKRALLRAEGQTVTGPRSRASQRNGGRRRLAGPAANRRPEALVDDSR